MDVSIRMGEKGETAQVVVVKDGGHKGGSKLGGVGIGGPRW